ncbi:MAG: nucleotidyltransferase domain-containing protein [Candidatus Aminicenantes bacterium]|nr:nucleotidyltransferase domain-containing protein [Candidatus Aminicenantes bacterium]
MHNYEILERLFASKLRVRLLDAFLSTPAASFYVRELSRKIKEDATNISRELRNLEAAGLLISELRGNQKYYSASEDFFLYPELKAIIFKTTGVQGLLRKTLQELAGIEVAFIYGSYATGKEAPHSDIDVLIIGKPNLGKLGTSMDNLEEQLSREVNYICFDRGEFEERKKRGDPFIAEVLSERKIFLAGSEDELRGT